MKTSLQQLLPGIALAFLAALPVRGQGASPALTVYAPMLINGIAASDEIVFALAGDLWRVGRAGGEARRIAELPGEEDAPAFSPDGSWLAFSRSIGGGSGDVWVMPAAGGEPRRLTWHPKDDRVRDWSPDGKKILFTSNRDGDGVWRLYTIGLDATMPEALPFPEGRQGAFSPDGSLLAVVPYSRPPVVWRYYRGGAVSPLWLARLGDGKIERKPART